MINKEINYKCNYSTAIVTIGNLIVLSVPYDENNFDGLSQARNYCNYLKNNPEEVEKLLIKEGIEK